MTRENKSGRSPYTSALGQIASPTKGSRPLPQSPGRSKTRPLTIGSQDPQKQPNWTSGDELAHVWSPKEPIQMVHASLPTPNPFTDVTVEPAREPAQVVLKTPRLKITAAGRNGTDITVILDESASMHSEYDNTLSGFNEFLVSQKMEAGKAWLNVVKFDGSSIRTICNNKVLKEAEKLTKNDYNPVGYSTNLLDAVGSTIEATNKRLSKNRKRDRAGPIIVVMTDGLENSSSIFTKEKISGMVNECEDADWVFLFLGANIDAFKEGSTMGFAQASTLQANDTGATYVAMASAVSSTRQSFSAGKTTEQIYTAGLFTDEDRNKARESGR